MPVRWVPHGVSPPKPNALVCCSVPRFMQCGPFPKDPLWIDHPCPPRLGVVGSSLALGTCWHP
jgi:hypothetical protein